MPKLRWSLVSKKNIQLIPISLRVHILYEYPLNTYEEQDNWTLEQTYNYRLNDI